MNPQALALPITPDIGNLANRVFTPFQIKPDGGDATARAMNDADPKTLARGGCHALYQSAAEAGHLTNNRDLLRVGSNDDGL